METSKKILALDSSGLVASVAVVGGKRTNNKLVGGDNRDFKKTKSMTLHSPPG